MHENHAINYNIEYFRDYLKGLDIFLYKESRTLTTGEYVRIMIEMEEIREHIIAFQLLLYKNERTTLHSDLAWLVLSKTAKNLVTDRIDKLNELINKLEL